MLTIDRLNAFYGDSHVLHDVSASIAPAARVAILGRNGAGKSTLLKSIIGDEARVEGGLSWKGQSLVGLAPHERARRGFSYVPEDRRIFPMMSVVENIEFASRSSGKRHACFSPDQMLDRFPMLKPLANRLGNQMSGGQQQMLAVARGLAVKPDVLLLDEPTEGLAPIIVEQLAESVSAQCRADNVTLVLSEQNIGFARRCTDYVYVLNSGSIVFEGAWDHFDTRDDIKVRFLAV